MRKLKQRTLVFFSVFLKVAGVVGGLIGLFGFFSLLQPCGGCGADSVLVGAGMIVTGVIGLVFLYLSQFPEKQLMAQRGTSAATTPRKRFALERMFIKWYLIASVIGGFVGFLLSGGFEFFSIPGLALNVLFVAFSLSFPFVFVYVFVKLIRIAPLRR